MTAHLEAEKESEIEKRVEERLRAKEEEVWRSVPGSHVGCEDDEKWDWDAPQWSNEQKERTRSSGKMVKMRDGGPKASKRSSLQPKEEW